jgi:hypothetical protein
VLCCFLLQGLNELIQGGKPHPRQGEIFTGSLARGFIRQNWRTGWTRRTPIRRTGGRSRRHF